MVEAAPKRGTMRGGTTFNRVPPPRLYVYFDAIIRHGSIRSAAEALRIASSALNRRLIDLEHEVGTSLFERLQSGVRLTEAGEIFAAHVRRTLDDVQQTAGQIQDLRGLVRGQVTIGAAESAAVDLLPQAMVAFQQDRPGARFTLAVGSPGTLLSDLLEDRVDLILTHQESRHHDVTVLARCRKAFCALMRPGHQLASRQSLFMHDCQSYPIVLAQEQMAARALVEATLATQALTMQPVLVTNMFEVMKQYVRQTDAISFQFYFGASADGPGGLAAIPLADPQLAEASLILAVRRGRVLPPIAAAFCDHLQGEFQDGTNSRTAGAH